MKTLGRITRSNSVFFPFIRAKKTTNIAERHEMQGERSPLSTRSQSLKNTSNYFDFKEYELIQFFDPRVVQPKKLLEANIFFMKTTTKTGQEESGK